ncbi:MAG: MbtH family NRPS accessory protein [Actinomycetota bacterium]
MHPFDDPDSVAWVLTNVNGEYSLWANGQAPSGWNVVYGPAPLADCEAEVERRWYDAALGYEGTAVSD